ncbi:hypothetical protein [Thauera sinica]|uniref:Uncharacterized protein n=1 Tax=Thauera sinica TaxID=2665146 RepID=A0ABW1AV64_9RHOO|nr:hypothetical protein [Thauera sp. K11]
MTERILPSLATAGLALPIGSHAAALVSFVESDEKVVGTYIDTSSTYVRIAR